MLYDFFKLNINESAQSRTNYLFIKLIKKNVFRIFTIFFNLQAWKNVRVKINLIKKVLYQTLLITEHFRGIPLKAMF